MISSGDSNSKEFSKLSNEELRFRVVERVIDLSLEESSFKVTSLASKEPDTGAIALTIEIV